MYQPPLLTAVLKLEVFTRLLIYLPHNLIIDCMQYAYTVVYDKHRGRGFCTLRVPYIHLVFNLVIYMYGSTDTRNR